MEQAAITPSDEGLVVADYHGKHRRDVSNGFQPTTAWIKASIV